MDGTTKKKYEIVEKKDLPRSELLISAKVAAENFGSYRGKAFESLRRAVTLPGFRKGRATDEALEGKLGKTAILEEASEIALKEIIPAIVREENISFLGRPEVSLTSVSEGGPISFTLKFALFPKIVLPDYKKIAAGENKTPRAAAAAGEKEVNEAIDGVRKNYARTKSGAETGTGGKETPAPLPELDDAFVKRLGDFKDVASFKAKVKESLEKEKERTEKEKGRIRISEALLRKTAIDVPSLLVEAEEEKMLARLSDDVARMGVPFERYLKHIKKTPEELRKEWRPEAEKRAKLELILNEIAVAEKLEAPETLLEKETAHILEHHSSADPARVRAYVETILRNEQVFEFLENQN